MADDATQNNPLFASGAPRVQLASDALPDNPKRVIRTFAQDVAEATGAPMPAPSPTRPAVVQPAPRPVATPSPNPAPRPSGARVSDRMSLSDAVAKIGVPTQYREEPSHLPPLAKKPPAPPPPPAPAADTPIYVRRPEKKEEPVPETWIRPSAEAEAPEKSVLPEPAVYERKPSWLARVVAFLLGGSNRTSVTTIPSISSYSPRAAGTPAPEPLPIRTEPEPAPAPLSAPAPSAAPTPAPTPTPPAPAGFGDEQGDREAVLARLRARVASYQSDHPTPAPVFPTPKPEAAPPAARRAPAPAPLTTPPEPTEPERLRTFSSDFSNRIDNQNASTFSVLAAQSDARNAPAPAPAPNHRGLVFALMGAVLIVGGSTLLYYLYGVSRSNAPVQIIQAAPPALVSADATVTLSGTGSALMASLAEAATTPIPIGNVETVYYASSTGATETGGALVAALKLPAPDILLRNLGAVSTVGIVHAGNETRAFFVLAANSYERTFAGMLAWEPTVGSDLAPLYPAYVDAPPPMPAIATTTATSSPQSATTTKAATTTPAVPLQKPGFVDEVVDSHDVRALKDEEGRTLLLYGYRDQNTLVIARDETSFSVILARLSAS